MRPQALPTLNALLNDQAIGKTGKLAAGEVALGIEGSFSHPAVGEPWEYSVVVVIRDGKGQEVDRKVVGVGSLSPGDQRFVSLSVEVFKPGDR